MRTCGSPGGRTLQLVVLLVVVVAVEGLCAEFKYSNVSMGLVLKCNFFFCFNLVVLLLVVIGELNGVSGGADVGGDNGVVGSWCSSCSSFS